MRRRRYRTPSEHRNPFDPLDGPVSQTIDLHQWTRSEVEANLFGVVQAIRRRERGALLHLVTGRGKHSAGGPVLRPLVRRMLAQGQLGAVVAWGRDDADGGFLVRLGG